jgi:hypothetical protein
VQFLKTSNVTLFFISDKFKITKDKDKFRYLSTLETMQQTKKAIILLNKLTTISQEITPLMGIQAEKLFMCYLATRQRG